MRNYLRGLVTRLLTIFGILKPVYHNQVETFMNLNRAKRRLLARQIAKKDGYSDVKCTNIPLRVTSNELNVLCMAAELNPRTLSDVY